MKDLNRRVDWALDEMRLLILGVKCCWDFSSRVSPGWLCRVVFRLAMVAGLALLIVAVGFLIAPSMQHRLVEQGISSARRVRSTNFFAGWRVVLLTASLGLAGYVVAERDFRLAVGPLLAAGSA
jgi:hypothetical protein